MIPIFEQPGVGFIIQEIFHHRMKGLRLHFCLTHKQHMPNPAGAGALDVGRLLCPAVDGPDLRLEPDAHQSYEARGAHWGILQRLMEVEVPLPCFISDIYQV